MSSDTRPKAVRNAFERCDFLRDPMCDARRAGQSRRFPFFVLFTEAVGWIAHGAGRASGGNGFGSTTGPTPRSLRGELTRAQLLVHHRHECLVHLRGDTSRRSSGALSASRRRSTTSARRWLRTCTKSRPAGFRERRAHPRLFLTMMAGLGFDAALFADGAAPLHPAAVTLRALLARTRRVAALASGGRAADADLRRGERQRARRVEGPVRAQERRGRCERSSAGQALRLLARGDGP